MKKTTKAETKPSFKEAEAALRKKLGCDCGVSVHEPHEPDCPAQVALEKQASERPGWTNAKKGKTPNKKLDLKVPTKETFDSLLFGAYNIGPEADPDTAHGRNVTSGATKTARAIYKLLNGAKPGTVQGVLLAVRLLAETTCAEDPEGYALHETWRGLTNEARVEDKGATIKLPEPRAYKLPKAKKGQCYQCRFAYDASEDGPTICPHCCADFSRP